MILPPCQGDFDTASGYFVAQEKNLCLEELALKQFSNQLVLLQGFKVLAEMVCVFLPGFC